MILGGTLAAQEFTKLDDYRIPGGALVAVEAIDPPFEEDPEILRLTLSSTVLEFETDGDASDCAQVLAYLPGDTSQYAQIMIDTTAQTLNGSLIVQCAVFRTH